MEYDTDTLTNAHRNRAASQKFFQQMNNQQAARLHSLPNINGLQPTSPMLHRSPSGAMRKIRQKREEKIQQIHKSSVTTTNQSSTEIVSDKNYRSLINSCGYQSILDNNDMVSYTSDKGTILDDSFASSKSLQLPSTTFSKPEPYRRTVVDTERTNFSETVDNRYAPTQSASVPDVSSTAPICPAKPTVEVHPMPAPRAFGPTAVKQAIIPPPIPKKPARLRMKAEINDYTMSSPNEKLNLSSEIDNITEDTSIDSVYHPKKPCRTEASSSAEALDQLHISPIVRSITECMNDVCIGENDTGVEKMTELEKKRIATINKLSNKVEARKSDLEAIKHDKINVRQQIIDILGDNPCRHSLEQEIPIKNDLIRIECVAAMRIKEIEKLDSEHAVALESRRAYWQEKIDDVRYLTMFVVQRISDIMKEISGLLSPEEFNTIRRCVDYLGELEVEETEISEKLDSVQKQIDQLQNISPLIR